MDKSLRWISGTIWQTDAQEAIRFLKGQLKIEVAIFERYKKNTQKQRERVSSVEDEQTD